MISGGFLHIDDNYGMELYVTKELKKVFPNKELIEIPKTHPIFKTAYDFPNGLPKIHEHDGKAPKAMGVFHKSRLILLFTFESDLGVPNNAPPRMDVINNIFINEDEELNSFYITGIVDGDIREIKNLSITINGMFLFLFILF